MYKCLLSPFTADNSGLVSVFHEQDIIAELRCYRMSWQCSDGELSFFVLAGHELELPEAEATEPRLAALARLAQWARNHQAYLILSALQDIAALVNGQEQHLAVCRFIHIEGSEDLAFWDRMLSLGMPMFALHKDIYCYSIALDASSIIQSLLLGSFYCSHQLQIDLDETAHGVEIASIQEQDLLVQPIIRGGLELDTQQGCKISWQDKGNEGYIRFELRSGSDYVWTQPRFVAMPGV